MAVLIGLFLSTAGGFLCGDALRTKAYNWLQLIEKHGFAFALSRLFTGV